MTYSNANFTPSLKGYSNVKPFRFWCQKVLPLVYDDSLSYYELLCKVVDYLNNVISDLSATEDNVGDLLTAYNQLQDYVNNYFTNLDVQEEINIKLDAMFEDGTIPTMIEEYVDPFIETLNDNYAELDEQINETMDTQNENIATLTTRVNNLVINNTTNLSGYNVVTVESATAEGGSTVTENIPKSAEILQVYYSGYNDTYDTLKSDNITYESTPNVPSSTQQQVVVTITDTTDTRFNVFITYAISQDIEIAELTDIRVGYDGTMYSSAGNAVREQVSNVSEHTRNLLPSGIKTTDVRGATAIYNNGILTITGTPTASGGRGIHLIEFTLDAGNYYFSTTGISSNVTGIYIEAVSDDTIIRTNAGAFTLSDTTNLYIGVNIEPQYNYNEEIYLQIEKGSYETNFISPVSADDKIIRETVSEIETDIDAFGLRKMNLFDKNDTFDGYTSPVNGGIAYNENYLCSYLIDIHGINKLQSARMFATAFYDENRQNIPYSGNTNSGATALILNVPDNAYYMRTSCSKIYADQAQIGETDIVIGTTLSHDLFALDDLVTDTSIIVSKSGASAYTSLLDAMVETDKDIIVRDGVFDIVAEYNAKYGNTFFNTDFDRSVAGDFALGLFVKNRKITFLADTSVTFDLTDIDVSYASGNDRRFSLFWMGKNAEIHGLKATTYHNWYAIHDDVAEADLLIPFTNKLVDCVIDSYNNVNVNTVGGGCGSYTTKIIDNCYFDNHVNDIATRTIRYHNTWHPYAKPELIIKNTFVNGRMYFGYNGNSTKIGNVIVNNCSMANTIELLPVTAQSVENLRLIQYCNDIRSD